MLNLGEDKILEAMSRFGHDGNAMKATDSFDGDVAAQMGKYRASLVEMEKNSVL